MTNTITIDRLRNEAKGRWLEILASICPELQDAISTAGTTRHHPCPRHGGVNGDAFRMHSDAAETGGCVCNTCGSAADGFATIIFLRECSFTDAATMVARFMGYSGLEKSRSTTPRSTQRPRPQHHQRLAQTNNPPPEVTQTEIAIARAKLSQRWSEAIPDTGRISAYLRSRGLSGNVPPSLRLIASLPYYEPGQGENAPLQYVDSFPAMVAQVHEPSLGLVAIHRTYLHPNEDPGKAPVKQPKKLTPPIYPRATTGAAIRLFPAASTLAVAEGVETSLAVHESTGTAVWSTISAGGMASLEIPSIVKRLQIWADSGKAGEEAADKLAQRAVAAGLDVTILTPPSGMDWLDVLNQSGDETLRRAIADAKPYERPAGILPEIQIHTKEHLVIKEAIRSLASDPVIYQRGGILVHVVRDASPKPDIIREKNSPRIAPFPKSLLRERMTACADWTKYQKSSDEWIPSHPPDWAVKAIHERGEWPGIATIEGVVETPVMRFDGSVLDKPGYDDSTGLLYEPTQDFPPVPENPTHTDAVEACRQLLDIVSDFPFATPAHESSWLASLLTPLARHAFRGPSPLFLSDANSAGAGKTMLCDIISWMLSGRDLPRTSYSTSDEEMRKRITAIALAGDPVILIDNIDTAFGCASLDAALTGSSWSDRVLSTSETITLRLQTTWYASGNNVVFRGDIARRTLHIRLECQHEKPEERDGFRYPDLRAHVITNRGQLVVAALTVLRAYHVAGRPTYPIKPWGSFSGWSNLIRNAIVWLGLEDPGQTRDELREQSDTRADALRLLLDGWEALDPQGLGCTVAEMLKKLREPVGEWAEDKLEPLREALAELCPSRDGRLPSSRSVGMSLKHLRGRVSGGRCLRSFRNRQNTTSWHIQYISNRDQDSSSCSSGDLPDDNSLRRNYRNYRNHFTLWSKKKEQMYSSGAEEKNTSIGCSSSDSSCSSGADYGTSGEQAKGDRDDLFGSEEI